jgi:hypothetical protein
MKLDLKTIGYIIIICAVIRFIGEITPALAYVGLVLGSIVTLLIYYGFMNVGNKVGDTKLKNYSKTLLIISLIWSIVVLIALVSPPDFGKALALIMGLSPLGLIYVAAMLVLTIMMALRIVKLNPYFGTTATTISILMVFNIVAPFTLIFYMIPFLLAAVQMVTNILIGRLFIKADTITPDFVVTPSPAPLATPTV